MAGQAVGRKAWRLRLSVAHRTNALGTDLRGAGTKGGAIPSGSCRPRVKPGPQVRPGQGRDPGDVIHQLFQPQQSALTHDNRLPVIHEDDFSGSTIFNADIRLFGDGEHP